MDRLDHISTATGRVIGTAETASAAKVYKFDDPSWHQHDVVSLQVTMDHLVSVKIGHPGQNLVSVQSQDSLW